ncbi:MAG: hypothetical protein DMF69_12625 [Acidobacteria bacterium]|nr:MAG: hypothetical protein DMF69_12625 [Acidobacteriota bacterium]
MKVASQSVSRFARSASREIAAKDSTEEHQSEEVLISSFEGSRFLKSDLSPLMHGFLEKIHWYVRFVQHSPTFTLDKNNYLNPKF